MAVGIALVRIFSDIIAKTQAAELATSRLTQAMINQGFHTKNNVELLSQLADQLQATTVFSNDQIKSAMAMLVSFQLNTKQVAEMTPLLLDLATMTAKTSGSMMDLESAAKQVGIALGGQPGMLTRMGIKLSDLQKELLLTAEGQDKLNVLMEVFEQNAGGLAKAAGETATGGIVQFKNSIDDLKKEIGTAFMPTFSKMAKFVTARLKEFNVGMTVLAQKAFKAKLAFQAIFTKKTWEEAKEEFKILDELLDEQIEKIMGVKDAKFDETESVVEFNKREIESYSDLVKHISELDTVRKDALITLGAESEEFKKANVAYIEAKKNLDAINESLTIQNDKYTALHQNMLDLIKDSSESGESLTTDMLGIVGHVEGIQDAFIELQKKEEESGKEVKKDLDSQKTKIEEVKKTQEDLNKEVGENFRLALSQNNEPLAEFQTKLDNINQRLIDIRNNIIALNNTPIIDPLGDL